jgi:uncharacterized protein YbcI
MRCDGAFRPPWSRTFAGPLEDAMGRPVVAFMSQVSLEPDISVEIFFLLPRGDGDVPAV